jgi:hypothetical protein
MNNRFTLKGRVILLLLLVFQLGLKLQASANTRMVCDTDTIKKAADTRHVTANTDTIVIINGVPTKVSMSSPLVKKDTASNGLSQDEIKNIPPAFNNNTTTIVAPPTDGTIQVRNFGMTNKNTTIVAPPSDGLIQVKDAKGGYIQGSPTGVNAKPVATKKIDTPATTEITKKVTDTVTKRVTDTITKTATDTITKAKKDTVTKTLTDTVTKTLRDTVTKTLRDTVTKTTRDTVTKIMRDTVTKTIRDTVTKTLTDTLVKKSDTTMMKKDTTAAMQQDTLDASQVKAKNVYLEVGGAGLAISANYDSRFGDQRDGWGYNIGVGGFVSGGNKVVTVPFQLNFLIGDNSSMIEAGVGATFLHSTGDNKGKTWEFDKITGFVATGSIGYRYQPQQKGISFRVAFVPILYDEGIIPAGGISVGYTFK